ncbi:MAG TPA: L,D-transpeptidase family protein [Croceibacterium sp.]|nr:L,D-transpeptidase family protein [Croceibacterium sp.]
MRSMGELVKWIGGTTVVAVVLLGSAVIAGHALDAEETAPVTRVALPAATPLPVAASPAPAAAPEPFVIKRILPIDGSIRYGEWHWDESGAPASGPLTITIDLEARVMSVFRDGYEIGATAVLLGTDEHPTPTGVFPILSKERHNVSEIYNNAPMPWTLRLTHDGVAIHGGSTVERGWASHGCIGTPDAFVSRLFAIARPGDKVIITRGKNADVGTPLAAL